jgi:hypothetical protein
MKYFIYVDVSFYNTTKFFKNIIIYEKPIARGYKLVLYIKAVKQGR